MNKPALFSRFCTVFLIMSFGLPVDRSTTLRPAADAGLSTSSDSASRMYTASIHADTTSPASTYLVNSTKDTPDADPADGVCADADGKCTLRAAIMQANFSSDADTILLPPGIYQLTRAGDDDNALVGDLDILTDLTIQGAGPNLTIVDGNGGEISNSSSNTNPYSLVTLQDSSLHDNHAAYNGGAIDDYSALVLSHTVLDKNSAGIYGGGLMVYQTYVPSTIEISQSTLSTNTAQYGGGIYYNDFVGNPSKMMVQNSTLSGNIASHQGGGIYAIGQARLTLQNATIAGNEAYRRIPQHYASFGGGLVITSTAAITAQNTLIGDNIFTNGITLPTPDDCYGSLLSLGNNLIQTTTNCSIYGTTYGNITAQDPLLDPLQNDGGDTPTRPLQAASPAIDAGTNSACPPSDQRGVPRPFDGNGDTNAICDIGAYEAASQLSQSIQFGAIPDKTLLDPPFVITATTSSGLLVDFSTDTPTVCSLSDSAWFAGVSSAMVHLGDAGRCILVARQIGNSTFNPAASISQFFDVTAAPEVISHLFLPLLEKK
jgi:CSLREA domain-containing protein